MKYQTLDELREAALARLTERGDHVIVSDWGTAPLTRADFIALAASLSGTQRLSLREALHRGLAGRRHLWALIEHRRMRKIAAVLCYRYGEVWTIRTTLAEEYWPESMDVPASVWKAARPDDRGANVEWRAVVAEYRRAHAA
jgi:hypothetical protein